MCQFPLCLFRSFCLCYNNDDFKTTLMMPSSSLLNATQNAIQIAPQKSLFPNINRKCYRPLITFVNVSCRLHRCNHLPLMMRRCCVKPTSHLHVLLCVSLGHPHQYGDLLTLSICRITFHLRTSLHSVWDLFVFHSVAFSRRSNPAWWMFVMLYQRQCGETSMSTRDIERLTFTKYESHNLWVNH